MLRVALALVLVVAACKDGDAPKACKPAAPIVIATLPRAEPTESADALTAEVAHCTEDCLALAKRELDARKKALGDTIYSAPEGTDPAPLDPRLATFIAAMDHYVRYAPPSDPDAPIYALVAAQTMSEYRHDADAIARCEAILRDYRDSDSAGYAANELLDLLSRGNQTADLRFWVTELLADGPFLEGKDGLRETLNQLRTRLESPG